MQPCGRIHIQKTIEDSTIKETKDRFHGTPQLLNFSTDALEKSQVSRENTPKMNQKHIRPLRSTFSDFYFNFKYFSFSPLMIFCSGTSERHFKISLKLSLLVISCFYVHLYPRHLKPYRIVAHKVRTFSLKFNKKVIKST